MVLPKNSLRGARNAYPQNGGQTHFGTPPPQDGSQITIFILNSFECSVSVLIKVNISNVTLYIMFRSNVGPKSRKKHKKNGKFFKTILLRAQEDFLNNV